MSPDRVTCRFERAPVRLRELTGSDEQCVTGVDTDVAIELLERLIANGTPRALSLTATDRDRLLAAIYRQTFGDRVQSTATCPGCGERFDLEFSIEHLAGTLDETGGVNVSAEGVIALEDGARLRLPTGEDELAVAGLPPEEAARELFKRCLVDGSAGVTPEIADQRIAEAAPVLDLDLDAVCPECGREQQVHFDLQFYLLRSIEQERRLLAREVHLLARAYGWGLGEILSLARTQRRTLVELVEADNAAKHGAVA